MPIWSITWENESGDDGRLGIVESDEEPTVGQVFAMLEAEGIGNGDITRVHRKSCHLSNPYDTDNCHCPLSSYMYIHIEQIGVLTLPKEGEISWRYATGDEEFFDIEDKPVKEDVKDVDYEEEEQEE